MRAEDGLAALDAEQGRAVRAEDGVAAEAGGAAEAQRGAAARGERIRARRRGVSRLGRWREILYMLVLRDLQARSKQAYLGYLWILIQPLLLTGVFSVLVSSSGWIKIHRY